MFSFFFACFRRRVNLIILLVLLSIFWQENTCTHTEKHTSMYILGVILGLGWIMILNHIFLAAERNGFLSWIIKSVCGNFILEPIAWENPALSLICLLFFSSCVPRIQSSTFFGWLANFFWGIYIFFFLPFDSHTHF